MSKRQKIYLSYLVIALTPLLTFFYPKLFQFGSISGDVQSFFTNLPYFCLLLASFLGFNLGVRKVFYISILLLLSYLILLKVPDGLLVDFGIGKVRARQILALSLPIGLLVPYLFNHAKFISLNTLYMTIGCVLPFFIYGKLFTIYPSAFIKISMAGYKHILPLKIPVVALISFIPVVYFLLSSINNKTRMFNVATIFSIIPFLFSVHVGLMSGVTKEVLISNTLISYCAISIMLLHSIYTLYWESVYYDPLTGIPNRRAMIDKFNDLNTGYGVAVIDIDKFKNFNDTYGHDEGDNVLKLVANMLYALSGGRAYRFGGEEFVLIYDHMNEQVLEKDLNRIRAAIAGKPFYIREGKKERPQYKFPIIRKITSKFSRKKKSSGSKAKKLQITVSMGGVIKMQITKEDKRVPYEDFLKLADNALYKAKDNGRNRVEMADHI